jgi:acetylornithine/N-succinyldiaminopimelate aminotransferase
LRKEHVLTVGAGDNVVRVLPPLTISEDEIRAGLAGIRAALEKLSSAKKEELERANA